MALLATAMLKRRSQWREVWSDEGKRERPVRQAPAGSRHGDASKCRGLRVYQRD